MRQFKISHGVPGVLGLDFLCENNREYQMISFEPADYFNLQSPGEYRVTVWVFVYKQSDADRDHYKRIDLPPVAATIKWEP
jgi:hypothetical protein